MKVRYGFVSNSSSSSFVMITVAEVFDNVLNTFDELKNKIVSQFIVRRKFLWQDIVELSFDSGDSGDWCIGEIQKVIDNENQTIFHGYEEAYKYAEFIRNDLVEMLKEASGKDGYIYHYQDY